ncbi:hypothetical protein N7U49_45385 [Streptomyces sp. AD2-2]|nr:hypothetical protein N7U49_45385 [Streptomyces sp. AD2-2]
MTRAGTSSVNWWTSRPGSASSAWKPVFRRVLAFCRDLPEEA